MDGFDAWNVFVCIFEDFKKMRLKPYGPIWGPALGNCSEEEAYCTMVHFLKHHRMVLPKVPPGELRPLGFSLFLHLTLIRVI